SRRRRELHRSTREPARSFLLDSCPSDTDARVPHRICMQIPQNHRRDAARSLECTHPTRKDAMIRKLVPFLFAAAGLAAAAIPGFALERSEVPAQFKWDLTALYP